MEKREASAVIGRLCELSRFCQKCKVSRILVYYLMFDALFSKQRLVEACSTAIQLTPVCKPSHILRYRPTTIDGNCPNRFWLLDFVQMLKTYLL